MSNIHISKSSAYPTNRREMAAHNNISYRYGRSRNNEDHTPRGQILQKKVWIDYDEGADVLYISFVYPPNSIEHEEDENGIIRNYDKFGKLTGLTIISAKRFSEEATA